MLTTIGSLVALYVTGYVAVWAERAQKLGRYGGRIGTWKWPLTVLRLAKLYLKRGQE